MIFRILLFIIMIAIPPVLAADAPPPIFIQENPETSAWLLGVLLLFAVGVLAYYVKTSDSNNKEQWFRINDHETRLSHIEGEHKSNHGGRRAYDPESRKNDST